MDPSLLREREAFKKKALSQAVVEKRKEVPPSASSRSYHSQYSPEASSTKKQRTNLQPKFSGTVTLIDRKVRMIYWMCMII
jgi:hypothetical protein